MEGDIKMADEEQENLKEDAFWKVPEGYEWYELQIAGHHHDKVGKNGQRQIGILKNTKSQRLLKPMQPGARGLSEVGLYNTLFVVNRKENLGSGATGTVEEDRPSTADDPILADLAGYVPVFYGTVPISLGREIPLFMELEDITAKYRHPCVTDVKIGVQTFDPSASQEKIAHERQKYPQQSVIGFRVLGMKLFNAKTAQMETRDKVWGFSLKEDQIPSAFDQFLAGRHRKYQQRVCDGLLLRTKSILSWFERQRRYHFYSSSLLLVYEGDEIAAATSGDAISDVRMIDFAHVVDARNTSDANYLFGLRSVVKHLEGLRSRLKK